MRFLSRNETYQWEEAVLLSTRNMRGTYWDDRTDYNNATTWHKSCVCLKAASDLCLSSLPHVHHVVLPFHCFEIPKWSFKDLQVFISMEPEQVLATVSRSSLSSVTIAWLKKSMTQSICCCFVGLQVNISFSTLFFFKESGFQSSYPLCVVGHQLLSSLSSLERNLRISTPLN